MPSIVEGLLFPVLSFLIAAGLCPVMIGFARSRGYLDLPGPRKVHTNPVPRLGGICLFFAIWPMWFLFSWRFPDVVPFEARGPLEGLFWGTLLVWVLGVYDDLFGADAIKKLSIQFVAAAIAVSYGVRIELLFNPFTGSEIFLGTGFIGWTVSLFWIVIVTNAINLIDGLDGLAGGVCLITALSIYFISDALGVPHLPYLALIIAGAALGFLVFNFSPARIFLGDSGSLFLGFLLACISIMGTVKRSTAVVMFGPPLILALPVADTLFAVVRRFLRAPPDVRAQQIRRILSFRVVLLRLKEVVVADQGHIHHALLRLGLSHRRATIFLYLVTAALGASAYQVSVERYYRAAGLLVISFSLLLIYLIRKVRRH